MARPGRTDASIAVVHHTIRDILASEPTRVWRAHEVAAALHTRIGGDIVDAVVALAILAGDGLIERTAPGRYRAPTATPEELIERLNRELGFPAED